MSDQAADAPMTAERLALIIGGSISGILDAVFQYAAGQVAAAVTPGEARGEPVAEACARCTCPRLDGSLYCGHCAMGERPPQACDTGSAAGDKPYACYAQDSCAFDKRCPNYRGCRRVEPEEAAELERLRAFRDRAAWSAGHYRDIAQEHGDDVLRSVADTLDGWLAKAGTADGAVVIDDRADQLQRLAAEILAQFTEEGHPGRWATRTHWVANDRLRFWRDVLDGEVTYRPPMSGEPI